MISVKNKNDKSGKPNKEKIIKKNKIDVEEKNNELIMASDTSKDFKKEYISNKEIKHKKESNDKEEKNYKDEKKHKVKRLFFGLGKEFWRISWPSNKKMLNDFITTIIVIIFLVLVFSGIGFLIGTFIK